LLASLIIAALIAQAPPPTASRETKAAAAEAPDTLSIADCVALARQHAPALLVARRRQSAAGLDSAAAALNRRPDVSLRAGGIVAPRGFYDPVVTNLGEYEVKAGLDWPVADAGARGRARARSALDLASARWRTSLESRDAGLQAGHLGLSLLRLAEAESLQRQSLDWLAGLTALVGSGIASGARPPTDSIRVALERDAVEAALEDTRLEAQAATLELDALIAREGEGPLAIRAIADAPDPGPQPADSLRLEATLARQPEVQLARVAEADSRLDLEEARRRSAPTLDLSLDAGLAGADLTRATPEALMLENPGAKFADRLRQDLGASLALRLRLPVLDGARSRRVGARTAEQDAAVLESRAAAAAQERRGRVLLAEWRSASRRLRASEVVYERAERNLLKVKSLYSGGATSLLDLLDARRVFEESRDRLAEARMADRWVRFQIEDRR
jgi:outer membrane protein TolC